MTKLQKFSALVNFHKFLFYILKCLFGQAFIKWKFFALDVILLEMFRIAMEMFHYDGILNF